MLDGMHTRAHVSSLAQHMTSRITGVMLIDATGREREVSKDFAISYEVHVSMLRSPLLLHLPNNSQLFTKAIALFFEGDKMEARIQRHYMERGKFDLCIDQGTQVVQIDGEQDWSKVEPGTKVIMRAVLLREESYDVSGWEYQCPRCETWNYPKVGDTWNAVSSNDWYTYVSYSSVKC